MDYIVLGIVAIMVLSAVTYIIKAKKSGVRCIGCPSAGKCGNRKHNNGHCDCSCK